MCVHPLPNVSSSLPTGPAYPFFPFSAVTAVSLLLSLALAAAVPPSSQHREHTVITHYCK